MSMKLKKSLVFLLSFAVFVIIIFIGIYLYAFWEIDFNENAVQEITSDYITEVYSYDYQLGGKYLNDFLDENYRDQVSHKFFDGETVTCIFGENDTGEKILFIKTWRVFLGDYVIVLEDYFDYQDSINYIESKYSGIVLSDVSMEIMVDWNTIDSENDYYVGFLIYYNDSYTRIIFYHDQIAEFEGRYSF